jgi:hypothetical protein
MTPTYLRQLADRADPDKLWAGIGILDRRHLTSDQRAQMDTGIALRRYAAHIQELAEVRVAGKSLVITPLSVNGTAAKRIDPPAEHAKYLRKPL